MVAGFDDPLRDDEPSSAGAPGVEPTEPANHLMDVAPTEEGDPTLILWMLDRTPEERLDALQGFVNSVWELRHGTQA